MGMFFSDIFKRKKKIHRSLRGIYRSLSRRPNDFLEELQHDLWKELEKVLF